jgi:D-alanyl-D-alanine carboxypeptidase
MAIMARAIIRDLPEYEYFVHIPAIKFGRRVTRNFNSLLGRYPGADGMKTGFICASGFNLVASATRNNRRLIAVVLGAPSSQVRAAKAAQLLERGFSGNALSWLTPSLGMVDSLQPIAASPPNLREDICGAGRKRPGIESDDDNVAIDTSGGSAGGQNTFTLFAAAAPAPTTMKPSEMLAMAPRAAEPVLVYTGPTKTGAALVAAVAVEEAKQTPRARAKGKKGRVARLDPKPAPKPEAKPDARPAAAKPVQASRENKPAVKPKPVAARPDPKPAAGPKVAAKPAADKPRDKPAAR